MIYCTVANLGPPPPPPALVQNWNSALEFCIYLQVLKSRLAENEKLPRTHCMHCGERVLFRNYETISAKKWFQVCRTEIKLRFCLTRNSKNLKFLRKYLCSNSSSEVPNFRMDRSSRACCFTWIRVCVFKETVQRDFAPSVFHQSNPGAKIFSIVANISLG